MYQVLKCQISNFRCYLIVFQIRGNAFRSRKKEVSLGNEWKSGTNFGIIPPNRRNVFSPFIGTLNLPAVVRQRLKLQELIFTGEKWLVAELWSQIAHSRKRVLSKNLNGVLSHHVLRELYAVIHS